MEKSNISPEVTQLLRGNSDFSLVVFMCFSVFSADRRMLNKQAPAVHLKVHIV
jgi:hypothetical protein